jgi:putative hydrolase of the HAD superfamily
MKKMLFSVLMAAFSLSAAPKAVVFDWGNVIAFDERSVIVDFMCLTFSFSEAEFERANLEKRKFVAAGKSDIDFWLDFAVKKKIKLPKEWPDSYAAALKASVGADPRMYALIDELKDKQIRVGLLSNINDRYVKLIRGFGFYDSFNPCLLSCEIGLEKPDQKAYELLLKTIEIPGHEIVFIDDKAENVEAAKKLGIDAIVFESVDQVRRELTARGLFNHDSQMIEKR